MNTEAKIYALLISSLSYLITYFQTSRKKPKKYRRELLTDVDVWFERDGAKLMTFTKM